MKKSTILFFAYLPYFLNDFSNIVVTGYPLWVGLDYAVRLFVLGFLLLMVRRSSLSLSDLGFVRLPITDCILWTVCTLAACMGYLALSEFVLAPHFPQGALGDVPVDSVSPLFLFDLTAGLVLVAVSEEAVCRGLTLTVLRSRLSTPMVYLASALLFSAMHWSLSAHTLVDAFVYGILFVPATLATGSVWPAVIAHFAVNFVLYTM